MRSRLNNTAVIIAGHGSRRADFQKAMKRVASSLQKKSRFFGVTCAYLSTASPSIPEAIRDFARKGAKEIKVLPYFLLTGDHVKEHIPGIIRKARKEMSPKVKITLCPYLGYDETIVALIQKRLKEKAL
jgi:sirohydrochlorin cobaltochelatase